MTSRKAASPSGASPASSQRTSMVKEGGRTVEASAPARAAVIVAIAAAKGGVAKTTTTLYIAARAAEMLGSTADRPLVAIVDRDRDRHLSDLVHVRGDLHWPGVTLLPDEELPPTSEGYRLILIDTPPGELALPSLREAQLVVVPCHPTDLGINKLVSYLENVERQTRMVSPGMRLVALLPVMTENTLVHRSGLDVIAQIAQRHRPPLRLLPAVPRRTALSIPDLSAPQYTAVATEVLRDAALIS